MAFNGLLSKNMESSPGKPSMRGGGPVGVPMLNPSKPPARDPMDDWREWRRLNEEDEGFKWKDISPCHGRPS